MSELALIWNGSSADIARDGNLLRLDNGLHTAIIQSLLIDRRADDDDQIPDGTIGRRGFYADPSLGSRLWLLEREKNLQTVVNRAREYVRDALQWLIDDGVSTHIEIATESQDKFRLAIEVKIHRPVGEAVIIRFQQRWNAEAAR